MALFSKEEIATWLRGLEEGGNQEGTRRFVKLMEDAVDDAREDLEWFVDNNGPGLIKFANAVLDEMAKRVGYKLDMKLEVTPDQYVTTLFARAFCHRIFDQMLELQKTKKKPTAEQGA